MDEMLLLKKMMTLKEMRKKRKDTNYFADFAVFVLDVTWEDRQGCDCRSYCHYRMRNTFLAFFIFPLNLIPTLFMTYVVFSCFLLFELCFHSCSFASTFFLAFFRLSISHWNAHIFPFFPSASMRLWR